MRPDTIVRRALGLSVPFNLAAACVLGFPRSALGQFAHVPAEVPPLYRALVALFLALFAGAYAWLCVQKEIDRAFVAFAAIGKSLAVLALVTLWLEGVGPAPVAAASMGDLVLAAIFSWWLISQRQTARQ
jgi:hypothetical protein